MHTILNQSLIAFSLNYLDQCCVFWGFQIFKFVEFNFLITGNLDFAEEKNGNVQFFKITSEMISEFIKHLNLIFVEKVNKLYFFKHVLDNLER